MVNAHWKGGKQKRPQKNLITFAASYSKNPEVFFEAGIMVSSRLEENKKRRPDQPNNRSGKIPRKILRPEYWSVNRSPHKKKENQRPQKRPLVSSRYFTSSTRRKELGLSLRFTVQGTPEPKALYDFAALSKKTR